MMNISELLTDSRKLVYILGGTIAVVVLITIIFVLRSFVSPGTGTQAATLEFWGVFDDRSVFDESFRAFEAANKDIKVNYRSVPFVEYEQTLLNALAAGQGPDVLMVHHTWLPKHGDKLRSLPDQFPGMEGPLMTVRQFQDTFVDVAATDLISDGKIYGMPLYVDTLGLFYNKDMLNSAGIALPPATWTEFQDAVRKLTQYDASHNIVRSGAALGTARNINRSTDILMMLMLQSGVHMTDDNNTQAVFSRTVDGQPVGERAVQFYTDFANPAKEVYTWNSTQDYSVDAFVSGKTAMMLNYSHQSAAVRLAAPRLNFGIARVPQASAVDARTYANYWPLTVSLQSQRPNEAWKLVHYLTAGDGTVPYLNASARPAARKDLINQQRSDPNLGVFAEQALTARSWYQIDNRAIETIFADIIDAVNFGRQSIRDALKAAENKISVLMSQR